MKILGLIFILFFLTSFYSKYDTLYYDKITGRFIENENIKNKKMYLILLIGINSTALIIVTLDYLFETM